ncbi:MAG: chemotaxis response regulator protein-glutamate methylesterase [Candidatus Methylomirabilales bacterium]
MKQEEPIRVLVVDDSALMRKLLPLILERDSGVHVVGTAMDGIFALKKIRLLMPDVITLDMDMPRMDGLTTLKVIVEEFRIPVVLVSSLTEKGADLTLRALEMGAVDFITKPRGGHSTGLEKIGEELIAKIRAATKARLRQPLLLPHPSFPSKAPVLSCDCAERVVAIAISTGGPYALANLLPILPTNFPAGILIVQHMPEGFTKLFAERLDQICRIEVKEAQDGDLILPGRALVAPGNFHLRVKRKPLGTVVEVATGPEVNGHRPSADVLFASVASAFGPSAVGMIMTGMGSDGVEGIAKMRAAGAVTLAQSEESCVIFGMPKTAIERGYIQKVLPLEKLAQSVQEVCS